MSHLIAKTSHASTWLIAVWLLIIRYSWLWNLLLQFNSPTNLLRWHIMQTERLVYPLDFFLWADSSVLSYELTQIHNSTRYNNFPYSDMHIPSRSWRLFIGSYSSPLEECISEFSTLSLTSFFWDFRSNDWHLAPMPSRYCASIALVVLGSQSVLGATGWAESLTKDPRNISHSNRHTYSVASRIAGPPISWEGSLLNLWLSYNPQMPIFYIHTLYSNSRL